MAGKLFRKYYKRLAKEGILKSVLCGLTIGFGCLVLSGALCWFMGWKQLWIGGIVCAAITAAASYLFYHYKFQPTTKAIAKRVDELGLEERILTMTELEGDDSYIAMRQREDAMAALKTVNASLLKIVVSVPLILAVAFSGVAGIGMTVVSALTASGVIKSGQEIMEEAEEEAAIEWVNVTYEVGDGEGTIEGEIFQRIEKGSDTLAVMAVPEDGWAFQEWSDGYEDPYRIDVEVMEDMEIFAIFGELTEGDGISGEGEGEGEGEGSESDKPGEGEGKGDGDSKEPGNGTEAGGTYEEINQVYDGDTYYGDVFDGAYEDAMEGLESDGNMSQDEKDMIGDYFQSIEK